MDNIENESFDKTQEKKPIDISSNIISFFIIDKESSQIKSFKNISKNNISNNQGILHNFLKNFIKYNNNQLNNSYEYKKIILTSVKIQAIFINSSNNAYVCLFNKKIDSEQAKLFLLHIAICYKNIYLKLSKSLENNENLFALIFTEIFLIPLMHNFDKAYDKLRKKIDLVLFGNSEYISTMLVDLESREIITDIGNLFQKNYKASFLLFHKRKDILEEISFHGINLKNNYLKSNDKNIHKNENSLKLELRATFPKPLFIIKFFPILKGMAIVHYFNQYKLSKSQIRSPQNPNVYIYDNYKEIDIGFFNLFNHMEENNMEQIGIIEKFFFEYFLILGNNIKENKDILQLIKEIIMEYFSDEQDLLKKLTKKLSEEKEKNDNKIISTEKNEETLITKTERLNTNTNYNIINNNEYNNNGNNKHPLEFSYNGFIKEFKDSKLPINNDRLISMNDVNIIMPEELSNVNEYSELNLSKNNIGLIKRNVVTSSIENNNNDFNIYNNYGIISIDTKNLKTETDNEGVPINSNEPFNIDITNIVNNGEPSKDEWGFKSILTEKNKIKQK